MVYGDVVGAFIEEKRRGDVLLCNTPIVKVIVVNVVFARSIEDLYCRNLRVDFADDP